MLQHNNAAINVGQPIKRPEIIKAAAILLFPPDNAANHWRQKAERGTSGAF
jgi:hypothetical protein